MMEEPALNRLFPHHCPLMFSFFAGRFTAPVGRPGLPTRTDYHKYNTIGAKSILLFFANRENW